MTEKPSPEEAERQEELERNLSFLDSELREGAEIYARATSLKERRAGISKQLSAIIGFLIRQGREARYPYNPLWVLRTFIDAIDDEDADPELLTQHKELFRLARRMGQPRSSIRSHLRRLAIARLMFLYVQAGNSVADAATNTIRELHLNRTSKQDPPWYRDEVKDSEQPVQRLIGRWYDSYLRDDLKGTGIRVGSEAWLEVTNERELWLGRLTTVTDPASLENLKKQLPKLMVEYLKAHPPE